MASTVEAEYPWPKNSAGTELGLTITTMGGTEFALWRGDSTQASTNKGRPHTPRSTPRMSFGTCVDPGLSYTQRLQNRWSGRYCIELQNRLSEENPCLARICT